MEIYLKLSGLLLMSSNASIKEGTLVRSVDNMDFAK